MQGYEPTISEAAPDVLKKVIRYWSDDFEGSDISLIEIALLLSSLVHAMDYLINIFDKDWLGVEPSASETQKIATSETETTIKEDK